MMFRSRVSQQAFLVGVTFHILVFVYITSRKQPVRNDCDNTHVTIQCWDNISIIPLLEPFNYQAFYILKI